MELRHLRYFVAVAEAGSFSVAARDTLFTSQPSLSRQIVELEEEVGTALFYRRARGVALTEAGATYLEYARQILRMTEDATEAARHTPLTVRVGLLPGLETAILPGLLKAARSFDSHANVRVMSASSPRLIDALRSEELDLAFLRQSISTEDIHFEMAGRHQIVAFMNKDLPMAQKTQVSYDDLTNETFISVNPISAPTLVAEISAWTQQKGLLLKGVHTAANIVSALSLMMTVGGFALLPEYADRLMSQDVVKRPLIDGPRPIPLMLGYRPGHTPRSKDLVNYIRHHWHAFV